MPSIDFIRNILNEDRKTFFKDLEYSKKLNDNDVESELSSFSLILQSILHCTMATFTA